MGSSVSGCLIPRRFRSESDKDFPLVIPFMYDRLCLDTTWCHSPLVHEIEELRS